MFNNYNDFINGKIFSTKNILDLLKENKLDCEILNVKYLKFGKIIIKAKNNNRISIFKVSLDKYSINLAKNEEIGYFEFNKPENNRFNLPKYKMININKDYALSQVEYLFGVKGNYLELKKFYNNNYNKELETILLKDYINLIKNRFQFDKINDDEIKQFNQIRDNFVLKFGSIQIPIDISHGDFIHFNSIKTPKKNYVYDLEFFQKIRSYLYDFIHWSLAPIFFKTTRLKINSAINSAVFLSIVKFLKFKLKNYYKKLHFEHDSIFEILLTAYLLERYLFFENQISMENVDYLLNKKERNLTKNNANLILKLLNKLDER